MNLSQKQLGINAGLDPSVASPRMNQYETGKHHPDHQFAVKICEVLDVPVAYLYCEDDDLADIIATFPKLPDQGKKKILSLVETHLKASPLP